MAATKKSVAAREAITQLDSVRSWRNVMTARRTSRLPHIVHSGTRISSNISQCLSSSASAVVVAVAVGLMMLVLASCCRIVVAVVAILWSKTSLAAVADVTGFFSNVDMADSYNRKV